MKVEDGGHMFAFKSAVKYLWVIIDAKLRSTGHLDHTQKSYRMPQWLNPFCVGVCNTFRTTSDEAILLVAGIIPPEISANEARVL